MIIPPPLTVTFFSLLQSSKERREKKKGVKKDKKKDRRLIEESILRVRFLLCCSINCKLTICDPGQMHTLKPRAGSSKALKRAVEESTKHVSLYGAFSGSEHSLEAPRQHVESPIAITETPLLQPEADLVEIPRARSRAPSPEDRAERSTTTGGDHESSISPKEPVSCGCQVAVGEEGEEGDKGVEQQIELHSKDAPAWVQPNRTIQHTEWSCEQVHWSGPATVDGQVVEVCSDSERGSFGNLPGGHINPSEYPVLDVEVNEQFDMDLDFSVPLAEDQFQLPPFGCLSSTTFNPALAAPLPPYNEGVEDQQDDIVLDGDVPECPAMEGAVLGPQQAPGILPATQMIQPLLWAPFVVSNNQYVSASGALPESSVEIVAFVDTPIPNFGPLGFGNLYAPDPVVLHGSTFPQAVPVRENASLLALDGAQSSISAAEMEPLDHRVPFVSTLLPTPFPSAPASCPIRCSQPLSPPLSPPTAVPTLASPSTSGQIVQRNRGTEHLAREIDSGPVMRTGIQRKMLPLRCV